MPPAVSVQQNFIRSFPFNDHMRSDLCLYPLRRFFVHCRDRFSLKLYLSALHRSASNCRWRAHMRRALIPTRSLLVATRSRLASSRHSSSLPAAATLPPPPAPDQSAPVAIDAFVALERHLAAEERFARQSHATTAALPESPLRASAVRPVPTSMPVEPDPTQCCGSGCERCVWTDYWADLHAWENSANATSRVNGDTTAS
jgi:hypothetical protein